MNDISARSTTPAIALLPGYGDNSPRNLPRAGTWIEFAGFNQLNALATGMTSGKQVIRLADVTALPDAWGQAVCFHAAFFNKEHVLHGTAIAEWRGLLALIALSQFREIELGVNSVDLNALADNPRGADKDRLRNGSANFGAAVRDSFPNFIDVEEKDRLQIDVLLCGKVPVGFTFDLTLVVPGRAYPGAFERKAIPWGTWEKDSKGCPLRDPSPATELEEVWQRDALRQWLERLRDCARARTDASGLVDELTLFIEDLSTPGGKQQEFQWMEMGQGPAQPARRDLIRMVLTVPANAMYSTQRFDSATSSTVSNASQTVTPSVSDRMLPYMPTAKLPPLTLEVGFRTSLQGSALKGAIIIDPDLVTEWGEIAIHPIGKSLGMLYGSASKIKELLTTVWKKELQQQGWMLLTPADLFTEKLSSLNKPTKFHQAGWEDEWTNDYLLPFTPLVLALYEPNALRKAFRMFRDRDGSIVVELDILLKGAPVESNKTLTLAKRYRETAQIKPPVRLTQWPCYVSSIWRHYYLDARGGKDQAPVARVIASDRLADMLQGLSDPDAVACAFAWGETDSAPLEVSTRQPSGLWRTCHLADRPVEAVTLEGADGLCLAQPIDSKPIQPVDGEFKIAVDFGSSGTRILAMGGGRAIPLGPLESKLSFIFSTAASDDILEDIVSQEGTSLLISSLATRPDTPLGTASNAPRVLSFVPHPPAQVAAARESLNYASGVQRPEGFYDARFGLKYGCKIDNVAPDDSQWGDIKSLLREYALFATAGVIGLGAKPENLRWAFAYPATFLASEKEKFEDLCKAATILPGRPSTTKAPSKDDLAAATRNTLMVVEPLAAYMHFRDHPRTRNEGIMITVDIGGHSTDICISCRNKLVWAGSLAIAGQHVFTDNLAFNPEALRSFIDSDNVDVFKRESAKLRPGALDNRDGPLMALRGYVEAALSDSKSEMNQKGTKDHKGEAAIRLFLFGLMEYIRLILERCHQNGKVEEGLPVALYFAGGGARLFFDWIGEKVCQRIFENTLESLPWSGQAASIFYDKSHAKMEVADGLLAALDVELRHTFEWEELERILDHSPLPLGEKVQIGKGDVLAYLDVIPTRYLNDTGSIRLDSIERFEEFLEQAKLKGVIVGKLNKKELLDRTCNAFEKEKRRGEKARMTRMQKELDDTTLIQLQPPFILALRTCIEMMVRSS